MSVPSTRLSPSPAPLPQHGDNPTFPTATLVDRVAHWATARPGELAIAADGVQLDYGTLWSRVISAAEALCARGILPGDVVVLQLPTCLEFAVLTLAIERIGAIVCPIIPAFDSPRLRSILALAKPRMVITVDRHRSSVPGLQVVDLAPTLGYQAVVLGEAPLRGSVTLDSLLKSEATAELPPPPQPGMLSELAFTSGSTGQPKGVLHSHATSGAAILSTVTRQEITHDDIVHVALPLGHNFGFFYGLRAGLYAGASIVLQQRWSVDLMLSSVSAHSATVSLGPPTFLSDLKSEQGNWAGRLDSLRLFTCAGAKLDVDLAKWASANLPGRLSKAFGMTELGHTCATGPEGPVDKVIETEGSPQPEIEMRIVSQDGRQLSPNQEGRIQFRGPFLCHGYVGGEALPLDGDGFFFTGDIGYVDQDGYLVVLGRDKNVVSRGGEKIPVTSVERAALTHPGVQQISVIGVHDDRLGERPVACVVTSRSDFSLSELIDHLVGMGVPKIHLPEAIVCLKEFPVTETGKLMHAELRRLASQVKFEGGGR